MRTAAHRPLGSIKFDMLRRRNPTSGWILVAGSRVVGDEVGEVGGNKILHDFYSWVGTSVNGPHRLGSTSLDLAFPPVSGGIGLACYDYP